VGTRSTMMVKPNPKHAVAGTLAALATALLR
jgi:hypothetical protein